MMHPDAELVEMFRSVRQDSRSDPQPVTVAESFAITLGFDGAGLLPTVGSVMILPIGNLRARITNAVLVANGIGSAVIALQLGTLADMPHTSTIYGSGNHPTLTAAANVQLDITQWRLNLQPLDVLMATLISVTSVAAPPLIGALTCVSLSVYCRRMKWPAGGNALTDNGGNPIVGSGGQTVQLRG